MHTARLVTLRCRSELLDLCCANPASASSELRAVDSEQSVFFCVGAFLCSSSLPSSSVCLPQCPENTPIQSITRGARAPQRVNGTPIRNLGSMPRNESELLAQELKGRCLLAALTETVTLGYGNTHCCSSAATTGEMRSRPKPG